MTQVINTVSVYRSLLQDEDYEIKEIAIQQLLHNINLHWTDIANDINVIEELMDDDNFADKNLVAILLSKIYFYLNDYNEALSFALKAGDYFKIDEVSDFTEILVHKAIEKYIDECQKKQISDEHDNYKRIVEIAIENSLKKNDLKLPLGISLDTRDPGLFTRIADLMNIHALVEHLLPHLLGTEIKFRKSILDIISDKIAHSTLNTEYQYLNTIQIFYIKGDYENASKIIYDCLKDGKKELAFSLALEVSEMHGFNKKVLSAIPIESEYEEDRKILAGLIEGNLCDEINNTVMKNLAKTDPYYQGILKKIEPKNSISHGSALMSLSFLQAFTQDDSFLQKQENMQWAGKCTHWNKFSSIASLGMIFKNCKDRKIFTKFMPGANGPAAQSHYANGGALYGLGLLYTGTCDQQIIDEIIEITMNPGHSQNEVIMHGACLGLGLTAFASGNEAIGERLKDILNSSTSVMGQASALALGLTFAGTNNQSILSDLIAIAQDTDYEKTLRSICLSIALISFGSPSDEFLENLEFNQNLKWAIPLYLASAYFKTSNPTIVRKLLKLSNDISNEVKRTSLIALGFVMYHDEKLVDIIKMLMYSYNPFIRYGAVMALAIGCKQSKEAIDLIWPLLTDPIDFVRQGTFIALSILMQVSTNNSEPKLEEFRKTMKEILSKPHGEIMAKMGAILSVGILDGGGRNMKLSLTTKSGLPKMQAITGMLIFCQYWNWFPYLNFLSLAITPSALIAVDAKIRIPKQFQIKSNCRPSLFDYPANIVVEEKKNDNKKEAAKELSTTNKAKARAALKKKQSEMEVQAPAAIVKKPSLISHVETGKPAEKKPVETEQKKEQKVVQKKEEETFSILNNPVRIAQKQKKYLRFVPGRYRPVFPDRFTGIIFVYDENPDVQTDYMMIRNEKAQQQNKMDIEQPIIEEDNMAPEDFEYDESKQLLDKKNE